MPSSDPNFLNRWLNKIPIFQLRRSRGFLNVPISQIPAALYIIHDTIDGDLKTNSKVFFRFEYAGALTNNLTLKLTPSIVALLDATGLAWTALNILKYTPSDGTLKTFYNQSQRYALNSNQPTLFYPAYTGQRLYGSNLILECWSLTGTVSINVTAGKYQDFQIPTSILGSQDIRYQSDFNYNNPVVNRDWGVQKQIGGPNNNKFVFPFQGQASNANIVTINTNMQAVQN